MPRRRVAVALIPPPALAASVQTLRRAVCDGRIDELPPHLTLIPPVNVSAESFGEGRALLRAVASATRPFELEVGPAGSFAPATPTLHLEVGGELSELHDLRARLRTGPFGRPDVWSFHPHVTLREELGEPSRSGGVSALSGSLGPWAVQRVHLLEQRVDDGVRRWIPIVEEPFGDPVVVGRGGIELELRTTTMVSEGSGPLLGDESSGTSTTGPGGHGLVVTATSPGDDVEHRPVGLVVGSLAVVEPPYGTDADRGGSPGAVAVLDTVSVDPGRRREGVGRHLLRRWCHEASLRGAGLAVAHGPTAADALLAAEGFVAVGSAYVRLLVAE